MSICENQFQKSILVSALVKTILGVILQFHFKVKSIQITEKKV